jgi:toxin ParE1/3/4
VKVIIAEAVEADLRDIARWIAEGDPVRAKTFSAEIRRACSGLRTRPRRFPAVRATPRGEIRKRVHKNYLILYRISPDDVEVVRIVHGSRDWIRIVEALAEFGSGPQ